MSAKPLTSGQRFIVLMAAFGEDLGLESINTFTKLKVNYVNFGGQKMNWG